MSSVSSSPLVATHLWYSKLRTLFLKYKGNCCLFIHHFIFQNCVLFICRNSLQENLHYQKRKRNKKISYVCKIYNPKIKFTKKCVQWTFLWFKKVFLNHIEWVRISKCTEHFYIFTGVLRSPFYIVTGVPRSPITSSGPKWRFKIMLGNGKRIFGFQLDFPFIVYCSLCSRINGNVIIYTLGLLLRKWMRGKSGAR